MIKKTPIMIAGFLLVALAMGCVAHFLMLSYGFFGSSAFWMVALLRSVFAFVVALLWFRHFLAGRWFSIALLSSLESGPILMATWALFNYSATGKIGFNAAGWIFPAIADLFAFLIGRHLGLKFTKLANQALNPTRARVAS